MTNIEVVLFDFDGVVNNKDLEYFSVRYAKEAKIDISELNKFFEGRFRLCSIGKADLKKELKPHLKSWNWEEGIDAFLQKWFEDEANLDDKMLKIIEKIKSNNIDVYLTTQQEKYRADYIWNDMKLKDYFDGKFVTCDIGFEKKNPKFFEEVINRLNSKPESILFWDDSKNKVDSAKSVGISAFLYEDFEEFEETMKLFFSFL